jgi:thiol-disulfide isomerase/thioredoxin
MRTCPATLTDSEHFSVSSGPGWESGMSGGGVFADGQLIGVGWGHGSGDPSAGWFTPLSAVAALLGRTPPASSAGPGEKPIVYVDVPAADWCPPCRALKPAYEAVKDSLEYQIVFRPVADDKRPNYPHVHVVDRSGNEQCAGALTAITDITAAWNRLHQ